MNVVTTEKAGEIAIVKISNPPVNALSHAVRSGLQQAAIDLDGDEEIKAVILICDGRTFIAGADIKEFGKPIKPPHLPDVINRLETSTKPWIAAIHGTALGGGFEVALGCHYRIGVASANIGLPEVHLGLIPGAGGTVRLPRLVDAKQAVELVSTGKPVSAVKASEMGILDHLAEAELKQAALTFAKIIKEKPLPIPLSQRNANNPISDNEWDELIDTIKRKARGQYSPVEAARAIRQACQLPASAAFIDERARFMKLRDTLQSKALQYVFFAERQTSKIERIRNVTPNPISKCGVLGGGTMGAGICAALLLSEKTVVLVEQNDAALAAALERIDAILQASLKRGLISKEKFQTLKENLSGSIEFSSFAECELVVEAVFEDMDVKRDVFSKLENECKSTTVLATNTSYLDINEIAAELKYPERVVGLHFFSPAHIMKLVEVVAHDKISDQVLADAVHFAKNLRKTPVLSAVCDGFIANRIMSAYRKECDYMLEDGCTPQQIDRAMKKFGLPMGMFEMADMAGLDIGWATRKRLAPMRNPDERYVKIADRLCELGRFGQKTGAGWYQYQDGSAKGIPDPVVQKIIEEESALNNITRRDFSDEEIMTRIISAMTNEAQNVLDEGIAQRASDIDMVMILGYGFPRWRGGPMFMAANTD